MKNRKGRGGGVIRSNRRMFKEEGGRGPGMKTSLKQLGHFRDVLCGKGFRGHTVFHTSS